MWTSMILLEAGLLVFGGFTVHAKEVRFPREDLAKVEVKMQEIRLVNSFLGGRKFHYEYTVISLPESIKPLRSFSIDMPPKVVLRDHLDTKPLWQADADSEKTKGTNLVGWMAIFDENELAPGAQMDGFIIESKGLPGIQTVLAWSAIDIRDLPRVDDVVKATGQTEESPDTELDLSQIPGSQFNHFLTFTTAPSVLPVDLSNTQLVNRLISLKDGAAEQGWIKDPGIVTSLNKKLTNALAALKRGQKKTARIFLEAFMHELDALRDKKHLHPATSQQTSHTQSGESCQENEVLEIGKHWNL